MVGGAFSTKTSLPRLSSDGGHFNNLLEVEILIGDFLHLNLIVNNSLGVLRHNTFNLKGLTLIVRQINNVSKQQYKLMCYIDNFRKLTNILLMRAT